MLQDSLVIYCVDVGSIPKGNFGWARVQGEREDVGTNIEALAACIAEDLCVGPVALGFECPLFVPLHTSSAESLCCRPGENNRSWSASAGISSLGAGLVESTWLLEHVRSACPASPPLLVSPEEFRATGRGLLVWEAFVTGTRCTNHEQDALAAARSFQTSWPNLADALPCHGIPVMSLIGMAALRTGWSENNGLLREKPIVINPKRLC